MANTKKSALSNEKELNFTPLYQDFVIELSPSLLLQIMRSYQLKASDVVGNMPLMCRILMKECMQNFLRLKIFI